MGIGKDNEVLGSFEPTGIRPKFAERLLASGIRLPMEMFNSGVPLQCDEPADFRTFRIGLFGLDKWHDVPTTLQHLNTALAEIAPAAVAA
jgi:hypothetical protein